MKDGFRTDRPDDRQARRITSPLDMVEGFLDDDLEAADDPLTGAKMARGTIIEWQQDAPTDGQDMGDWNADTNDPPLADGVGSTGDYYRVSTSGITALDDIDDWQAGQYLRFDGTWLRCAPTFFETDQTVFIVNRDTGMTASADYYFVAAKINGEWRILWLSCSVVRP